MEKGRAEDYVDYEDSQYKTLKLQWIYFHHPTGAQFVECDSRLLSENPGLQPHAWHLW